MLQGRLLNAHLNIQERSITLQIKHADLQLPAIQNIKYRSYCTEQLGLERTIKQTKIVYFVRQVIQSYTKK